MRRNALSDRMKEYERASELRLTRRLPMIIRLDGKAFHSWTKKVGCVRPFDHRLMDMMAGVTQYLCEGIAGVVLGYTQSDEISLLVRDDQNLDTDARSRFSHRGTPTASGGSSPDSCRRAV